MNTLEKNDYTCKERFHESITVLGARGSGKTSFLLNLENYLDKKISDKTSFLKILDPTLFESKQHVLLTIISIIIKKVEELKEKKEVEEALFDNYKNSLNNLAEGIHLLDGVDSEVSHKSIWEDSRINFNKGIKSSKSGIEFEEDFKEFIEMTLKYIKKEMIVLIFDDIDTNIEKGWPVLEVIRKYLTSLRLQVVVSGDWNLFSTLVRVKQFKNLNGINKIEDKQKYLKTIEILEEQYLTKILKPENRIMLQGLDSICRNTNIYVIEDKNSLNQKELKNNSLLINIYKDMIKELLKTEKTDISDNFIKLFLTLPLRSNIQLLFTYFKSKEKTENINDEFVDEVGKQYLTQLSRYDVTFSDFWEFKEDTAVYYYIKKSLEIVSNNPELDINLFFNLSNLKPIEDTDRNILFFILRSFISILINKRIDIALEWMFKVELFNLVRNADEEFYEFNKPLKKKKDYIMDNLNYLGHGVQTNLYEFMIRLNGFLNYQDLEKKDNRVDYVPGFIKVYKDKSKKKEKSYQYFLGKVSELEDKDSYLILSSIMFNSINLKRNSQSDLYGSIYFIIAFIGELIKGTKLHKSVKDTLKNQIGLSMIRPYADNNIHDIIDANYPFENGLEKSQLVNSLEAWLSKLDIVKSFPIETLNNTMKEFFYQDDKMDVVENFGDYITLQIFYFLNSLLNAEVKNMQKYNMKSTVVKRINKVDSAKRILDDNINKYKLKFDLENLSLFEFFYICPIWEFLIKLHSNSRFYNKEVEQKPTRNQGITSQSLFALMEEDDEDDKEEVIYQEVDNKFLELLKGLKAHKIKQSNTDPDEDIILNTEENSNFNKSLEHDSETYLKLILENEEKLKKYTVDSDEISDEYLNQYKSIIRNYYSSTISFRGKKLEELKNAIQKFSKIENQNVQDTEE
ncbi:hypothetical protein [Halarcobacter anaerophilus]|uniref:hypothetical protein n=1 Tax=Halarcobacter anaerophilus TaxID=877500 RepID=UPI0013E99556|nr:hypothetical protein [Halarcobacter anaerophilus]